MSAKNEDGKILSTANNDFTVSLYAALFPSKSEENLIFSPFSLHAVLGMVAQGARGDTRTDLLDGLQLTGKEDGIIAKSYNSIITSIPKNASAETYTLLTVNRVYCQTGFNINPAFAKTLKNHFHADFEQLDFSTLTKRKVAADKINKWVESITKSKIKDLISPDGLDSETTLVLVNGVYFKGFWRHKFDTSKTSLASFNVTPKKKINVATMHNHQKFPFGKLPKLNARAVALPYRGGRLSMVIILPNKINGLNDIQENLGSILKGGKSLVKDSLTTTYMVNLSLPKFKVEATLRDLDEVLGDDLKLELIFSEDADFSGITTGKKTPNLFVSSVIQKAFIEVNEEGAEAAAATAIIMPRGSNTGRPRTTIIPFVVDRPFYFQIVDHENHELVIFSGHVNDPSL